MSFLANVTLSPDQPRAVAMWQRVSRQTWGTERLSVRGCGSGAGRRRRAGASRQVSDAHARFPLTRSSQTTEPRLSQLPPC